MPGFTRRVSPLVGTLRPRRLGHFCWSHHFTQARRAICRMILATAFRPKPLEVRQGQTTARLCVLPPSTNARARQSNGSSSHASARLQDRCSRNGRSHHPVLVLPNDQG